MSRPSAPLSGSRLSRGSARPRTATLPPIDPYYAELWKAGERQAGVMRTISVTPEGRARLDALMQRDGLAPHDAVNLAIGRGWDTVRAPDEVRKLARRIRGRTGLQRLRFRSTSATEAILARASHRSAASVLAQAGLGG